MTAQTLLDIVLGIALLCWIGYRQLSWTAVAPERMWRMPALLAIIGVVTLFQSGAGDRISAGDLGVLAIETVISIGLGAVMGLMAHFRPIGEQTLAAFHARDRGRSLTVPTIESRTGWIGMALWLVLIAARIGGEVYAHMSHSTFLTSTGVILLTVALNRAIRIVVITERAKRFVPVAAGASVAA
jgi:hypothetical protein